MTNKTTNNLNIVSSKPTVKKTGKSVTFTLPTINIPKVDYRKHLTRGRIIFVVVLLVFAGLGGFAGSYIERNLNAGQAFFATTNNNIQLTSDTSQQIVDIANKVSPSVVDITDQSTQNSVNFFGINQPQTTEAEGTGIIISSNGLILTNRHVVPAGSTNITVTLNNGQVFNNVSVIGRTSITDDLDIAILKINNLNGQKLTPAVIGNSANMQVGDTVIAIGNALGQFQNTVTSGIISGYGRNISAGASSNNSIPGLGSQTTSSESLVNLFQTDAAINEGNSGGPLLNLNGQVIGINTAIASNSQNIGFSIPINEVTGLIHEVISTGKFARPILGVRFVSLNVGLAEHYHLSVSEGAYIPKNTNGAGAPILSGSAAQKAGLKPGDVITAIDGTQLNQYNDLLSVINTYMPGQTVSLSVVTPTNQHVTLKAKLGYLYN